MVNLRSLIKKRFILIILASILLVMVVMMVSPEMSMADPTTVELGTAKSFGVLAGSEITNTGTTWIGGSAGGDVGLYPGTAFTGSEDVTIENGDIYINDAVAEQAQQDLSIAYNDAAGRESDETISADLAGETLTPGVYKADTSMAIDEIGGTLTLDAEGDPNAVFIFQAGSTLTTASDSEVRLINGAQPCRVFWQVGSSATLGTNSTFVGHILADTSITANTEAEVQGQLLAMGGAVTLDTNTITNDVCSDEVPTGSLTVDKVVSGDTADMELPDFVITVTGPEGFSATRTFVEGESFTWENLVPGTYTVTEEKTGLSEEWTVSGEGDVEVVADQTETATITNTYTAEEEQTGSLTVDKVVSGDTADMELPDFEITVTGPEGFSATRTFVEGESFTWENLPPGEYTVTEDQTGLSEEWTVSGEGDVEVVADQTAVSTITNTFLAEEIPVGSLTVNKVVSGDTDGMTLPLFEITVTGPEGFAATRTFVEGESFTWENLVPGTYTVTEEKTGLSEEWTVSGEGDVEVVADQTETATITNTYDLEEEPELPRTGGMTAFMQLFGVLMAGAGALLYVKKK